MLDDDKDDQSILDQHVSRVWSDMTPNRSPGNLSPCNQFQRRKPHELAAYAAASSESTSIFVQAIKLTIFFVLRHSILHADVKVDAGFESA